MYVVCGRNVALGMYPTMPDAIGSIEQSTEVGGFVAKGENFAEVATSLGTFTVVYVAPSTHAEPLFY